MRSSIFNLDRRQLLTSLFHASILAVGSALGVQRAAWAIGAPTQVDIAYLNLPGAEPNPRPGVIEIMLLELARNTSVDVRVQATSLSPTTNELFLHPMLMLFGTRDFPPLTDEAIHRLETFLRNGGTLFIDDNSGLENSPFERAVRRECSRIFPKNPLERIPDTHVIYRTFFLINRISGRVSIQRFLEGVLLGGEATPIIFSRNDVAGALARDALGGSLLECIPGGEGQRELAYKLCINILMYSLCLNYKLDLTHVRALLSKRRGVFDE